MALASARQEGRMRKRINAAMLVLQWVLGLVVLAESCQFTFSAPAAQHFVKTGLPDWVRVFLGAAEILAALLFLAPRTVIVGGYSLVVIFFLAIVVHVQHGWFDVGELLVYAAAVLAVTAYRADQANERRLT